MPGARRRWRSLDRRQASSSSHHHQASRSMAIRADRAARMPSMPRAWAARRRWSRRLRRQQPRRSTNARRWSARRSRCACVRLRLYPVVAMSSLIAWGCVVKAAAVRAWWWPSPWGVQMSCAWSASRRPRTARTEEREGGAGRRVTACDRAWCVFSVDNCGMGLCSTLYRAHRAAARPSGSGRTDRS